MEKTINSTKANKLRFDGIKPIDLSIDITEEIKKLKKEMNAVILAHYYQESEIQDLADFIGDSLQLSQQAAETKADVIVFAGVHFMAETAKILNPDKPVLLPDLNAGCSLAEGCPAPMLKKFREKYPDHILISYINCTAEVKALSDIICTSSNAVKIVQQIPEEQKIIFAPDRNLGRYVMKKSGRDMVLWQGACIVHETFSDKKINRLKFENPDALLIAHPECEEAVLNNADYIGSTSGLLNFVTESERTEFIVATEPGIIHQMQLRNPHKKFIPAPPESNCNCNECPYMKLNTLEKLYLCMRDRKPEIKLEEEILKKSLKPLERMLEMSR
ncbi:MAG: quinolinate synthase NadA [Bacteroidetes bacterium]|nr:quinolinate synthase NadA [Bacteroidota bacterium]